MSVTENDKLIQNAYKPATSRTIFSKNRSTTRKKSKPVKNPVTEKQATTLINLGEDPSKYRTSRAASQRITELAKDRQKSFDKLSEEVKGMVIESEDWFEEKLKVCQVELQFTKHKEFRKEDTGSHTNYIGDFYNEEYKLIVEVDGDSHKCPYRRLADYVKDSELSSKGYKIIRVKAYCMKSFARFRNLLKTVIANRFIQPQYNIKMFATFRIVKCTVPTCKSKTKPMYSVELSTGICKLFCKRCAGDMVINNF